MNTPEAISTFQRLLGSRIDLVSRVAAALWSRVGRPSGIENLRWIEPLVGDKGSELLHQALLATGAITSERSLLEAKGVAHFCAALLKLEGDVPRDSAEPLAPNLVWTLPSSHPGHTTRGNSYAAALLALVEHTEKELVLVSPFVDESGVGILASALLTAMRRKVSVVLLTVNATNIASFTSRAIDGLRREAERAKVSFIVYTADPGVGKDRGLQPLIHAKLAIGDRNQLLLGSANLTSYALTTNFEAGVLLGQASAEEAYAVVTTLLKTRPVHLVFRVDPK